MFKNKYMTAYLSFVIGFGLMFLTQLVLAVSEPDTAPLEGSLADPVVHSMDIAGGSSDPDGEGVSVDNDGGLSVTTNQLIGSYTSPKYGMTHVSNKGGVRVISPYNPIAARSSMITQSGGNAYGRVGVEGTIIGDETGANVSTKGFVGHVKSLISPNIHDYKPLSGSLTPYSFYTTGDTRLGGTVTIDGDIKNNSGDITISGAAEVRGNVEIGNNLETDVLNYSNTPNLDARFFEAREEIGATIFSSSSGHSNGDIFTNAISCPADAYVIGCSGNIVNVGAGSNKLATYRGARLTSSNPKGGECAAYARKPNLLPPPGQPNYYDFSVAAYAYCFRPH